MADCLIHLRMQHATPSRAHGAKVRRGASRMSQQWPMGQKWSMAGPHGSERPSDRCDIWGRPARSRPCGRRSAGWRPSMRRATRTSRRCCCSARPAPARGLVARVIHDSGPRAGGPFIDVNCAAIPETMLEAELFGFEAGAFTDAKRTKPGLFEAASGGTLFLDEIDSLSPPVQSKVLKAIEEKRVRRLGAVTPRAVDVKLIAATQTDLPALVAAGTIPRRPLPPARRPDSLDPAAARARRRRRAARRALPAAPTPARTGWCPSGSPTSARTWLSRLCLAGQRARARPSDGARHAAQPRRVGRSRHAHRAARTGKPRDVGTAVRSAPSTASAPHRATAARGREHRDAAARPHRPRRSSTTTKPRASAPRWRAPAATSCAPHSCSASAATRCATACVASASPSRPSKIWTRSARRPPARHGAAPRRPSRPAPLVEPSVWEQKPVAVLTISLAFPDAAAAVGYEPWTAARRWERAIVERVEGFGGVFVQRAPSRLTAAFGVPRALEQTPQRAVQAALAILRAVEHGAAPLPRDARRGARRRGAPRHRRARSDRRSSSRSATRSRCPSACSDTPAPARCCCRRPRRGASSAASSSEPRPVQLGPADADRLTAHAVVRQQPRTADRRRRARRRRRPSSAATRELDHLVDAFARAAAGHGQVVFIAGEAGIGKSRLLAEFRRRIAGRPYQWIEGRCASYGSTTPFLPLIDGMRRYLGIDDRDDEVSASGQDRARASQRLGADLAWTLPFVSSCCHSKSATTACARSTRPAGAASCFAPCAR